MTTSSPSRLRARPGFTFVEIILVCIILAIVTTLGVGGLKRATQANRVKRAARMVAADMQYAFTLAGARRRPVLIVWDSANTRYRFTNRVGDTTYFRRDMGMGTTMQLRPWQMRFSTTPMTVFPNGLAADTLGVMLAQTGDTSRVWVARGGTTRIR